MNYTPSKEQVESMTRAALHIIGTLLVGYKLFGITDAIWQPMVGSLLVLISAIWGLQNSTPSAVIATVAKMADDKDSPVAGVIMVPTAEGHKAAAAQPSPNVVVAGTTEAIAMISNKSVIGKGDSV